MVVGGRPCLSFQNAIKINRAWAIWQIILFFLGEKGAIRSLFIQNASNKVANSQKKLCAWRYMDRREWWRVRQERPFNVNFKIISCQRQCTQITSLDFHSQHPSWSRPSTKQFFTLHWLRTITKPLDFVWTQANGPFTASIRGLEWRQQETSLSRETLFPPFLRKAGTSWGCWGVALLAGWGERVQNTEELVRVCRFSH